MTEGALMDWHQRPDRSCAGTPEDWWFFDVGSGRALAKDLRVQRAARICAACPVRQQCAADTLRHNDDYGIRAGVTLRSRNRVERLLAIAGDAYQPPTGPAKCVGCRRIMHPKPKRGPRPPLPEGNVYQCSATHCVTCVDAAYRRRKATA